jgi:hypothetical protein
MADTDMIRLIVLSVLISFLSLLSRDSRAQTPEKSPPADVGEKIDEVSSLDLFDEDTELTENGWAQFYVSAGFMYLDGDGKFSARLPDGRDVTIIDFDRAGLKETDSSYWLSLNWRSATSRWGAWFGSWQYDVTGSREWQDSLPIGGTEIPVGASVTSDFDAKWYILEATYSFYRSESVDTGFGFGFHTVDLDTTVTARFQIGDQETKIVSNRLDTLAPLPNVLVYLHWKFAPRWNMVTRLGYFGLDYDKYSGQMTNAHAMVNYQLSPRWSLGFGYQFVDLELDVEKTDFTQVYDIEFSGPMAFAKFRF